MSVKESGSMRYARNQIDNYEGFKPFSIDDHNEAMDCMDCDVFIQAGVDLCELLFSIDQANRKAFYKNQAPYDAELEQNLIALFRRWFEQSQRANDWIDRQIRNGYRLENLNKFRICENQVRALLKSLQEEELPNGINPVLEKAIREHNSGETAEFV